MIPKKYAVIQRSEFVGVPPMPLREAVDETFNDPRHACVELEF